MQRLQQVNLENDYGEAPYMVEEVGAHWCVGSTARGRSSGEQQCSSTPDVKVVAGCEPGKVLWLGGEVYSH
jgi:hypothetical protein